MNPPISSQLPFTTIFTVFQRALSIELLHILLQKKNNFLWGKVKNSLFKPCFSHQAKSLSYGSGVEGQLIMASL